MAGIIQSVNATAPVPATPPVIKPADTRIADQTYNPSATSAAPVNPPVAQASTTTYTPPKLSDPTTWTTTPDQTVAGQITNLTDPNSPIIQQARTRALQQANSRGILNSPMAMTGADSAAYDAALQIAQADAANASKVAGYNADTSNQFKTHEYDTQTSAGLTNAAAQNQGSQFNTGQTNVARTQQVQQGFDLEKMGVDAANTLKQMTAEQQNNLAKMAQQQGYNLQTMTAQQINDLAKMSAGQTFDLAKMDKQAALTISQMSVQQQQDMAQLAVKQGYNLDTIDATQAADLARLAIQIEAQDKQALDKFGYDKQLVQIQRDSNREIAGIEAQYKNLTQASASASSILNNLSTNVARIMENTDLDATAKQKAIDIYNGNAVKSLQLIGALSGDLELSTFLDDVLGTAGTPPPPTTLPPPPATPTTPPNTPVTPTNPYNPTPFTPPSQDPWNGAPPG